MLAEEATQAQDEDHAEHPEDEVVRDCRRTPGQAPQERSAGVRGSRRGPAGPGARRRGSPLRSSREGRSSAPLQTGDPALQGGVGLCPEGDAHHLAPCVEEVGDREGVHEVPGGHLGVGVERPRGRWRGGSEKPLPRQRRRSRWSPPRRPPLGRSALRATEATAGELRPAIGAPGREEVDDDGRAPERGQFHRVAAAERGERKTGGGHPRLEYRGRRGLQGGGVPAGWMRGSPDDHEHDEADQAGTGEAATHLKTRSPPPPVPRSSTTSDTVTPAALARNRLDPPDPSRSG